MVSITVESSDNPRISCTSCRHIVVLPIAVGLIEEDTQVELSLALVWINGHSRYSLKDPQGFWFEQVSLAGEVFFRLISLLMLTFCGAPRLEKRSSMTGRVSLKIVSLTVCAMTVIFLRRLCPSQRDR